jgi:hypothetical protein
MFDKSNEVSVLKTRIKMLEQRKQRLLASLKVEGDKHDQYFAQSELDRIDFQLQETTLQLAQKTYANQAG